MKKIIILVTAMLIGIVITAQENKVQKELKSYLSISPGLSFPVGDFASTNENNENAGFAETGINIDLTYGYKFTPYLALELSGLYNYNSLDKRVLQGVAGAKTDHFKVIGFMAGPAFSNAINDNVEYGFRLRGGFASSNSPSLKYAGEVLLTEDWAGNFIWSGGFNMKFNVSKKGFVAFNADYFYTKPEFSVEALGETLTAKQKITGLNINVGFGFKF